MTFAPVATLLVRPFRGYEELARAGGGDAPTIREGVLRLLFVIGAVVALTATGRLAPAETFVAMASFAYVPAIQLMALAVALRAVAPKTPLPRAFALYLAGHGPWLMTLLVIAAVCLLAPSPAAVLLRVAPPLVLGTFVWGSVLTYACLRWGLGIPRPRAVIGALVQFALIASLVVGYYLAMGQLGPQIWR